MSGLCGWLGIHDDEEANVEVINRMGDELSRYDHSKLDYVVGSKSALAVAALGFKSSVCNEGNKLAAIQGDYYWDDSARHKIDQNASDSINLLRGYAELGDKIFDKLKGRFSAAIVDESKDAAVFVTDRIGFEPVVYSNTQKFLVFGSTANVVNAHPEINRELDVQELYNYLYFHVAPSPCSIYKNHHRLMPGSYARFSSQKIEVSRYWQINFQNSSSRSDVNDLKAEFIEIIKKGVTRSSKIGAVGSFLSGGTDSSTVSGMLKDVSGGSAESFSIGFDQDGYDEMEYARLASKHFGIDHHEYYVTPEDVANAIPKIAQIYSEPFGNSSAIPTYFCAKLASESGKTHLLAGDGGDELFAGNTRYMTQLLFEKYFAIPKTIRNLLIEPSTKIPWLSQNIMPLRKIRSFTQQANVPMPARMETYNLLERMGGENIFEKDVLDMVDISQPIELMTNYYSSINADGLLNRMLGLDIKFTLTDNDLPKVSKMCELAGINVSYPLLSDELIQFSAQLPENLKIKGSKLRFFFKDALSDFLPKEIIHKKKQGFGLPFGMWVMKNKQLRDLAEASFDNLKSRNVIRSEFIDELMAKRMKEHAPYYGSMVWLLLMLEQWYAHHVDT